MSNECYTSRMTNRIHTKIQDWYMLHGRKDLPWRTDTEAYAIYLSEVMLQQTQVKTVLERYYFPFLKRFPTLEALGKASIDDVLKMWEGLGYYNRAKNLHKTAQMISALPEDLDALQKLPGIGINTAHAIASFAYGQAVPIMEANVKRILCRLDQLTAPKDKELWALAYALLDETNAFDYNQAMMDIGAMVCTPKDPDCPACPLSSICKGQDNPIAYPIKKKKKVPTRETYIMIRVYEDRLALVRREGKFLHGLWGFEATDVPLCASEYIGEVTQLYTHFKSLAKIYLYHALEADEESYFSEEEIRQLAISKIDDKILSLYLSVTC